jgi:hypothetical protein
MQQIKTQPVARHLPEQGAVASREGRLARQRSGGLGRDVRVVGVGAPLWGGQSRLQHSFFHFIIFSY